MYYCCWRSRGVGNKKTGLLTVWNHTPWITMLGMEAFGTAHTARSHLPGEWQHNLMSLEHDGLRCLFELSGCCNNLILSYQTCSLQGSA